MTHDPEKNAPVKLNISRIQQGLSKKQMTKIEYECDLLRVDVQKLVYMAPHLFNEGVTAANTVVIPSPTEPIKEIEKITEEETSINNIYDYEGYYGYSGI